MTSYVILFMYDVTKSLKMRKWRHISSHVSFIEKCPVITFFSMKFLIEWAIWELSMIILKFFERKIFNGKEFLKIEGQFAKFQPIFNLKTVLNSHKIGESSVDRRWKSRHLIFFPLSYPPPLLSCVGKLMIPSCPQKGNSDFLINFIFILKSYIKDCLLLQVFYFCIWIYRYIVDFFYKSNIF